MALRASWRATGAPLYVSTEAGALTINIAGQENYSFDGEGRLVGAWLERITYRRALDSRVLAKWIDPARPTLRQRRFLEAAERLTLFDTVQERVATVAAGLRSGALGIAVAPGRAAAERANEEAIRVREWLEVACAWDGARLEVEAGRFAATYQPVPILPPDQYVSLVIQVTEGCSYNACSFCAFYRDRPFRIKTLPALEQHIDAVLRFVGRGIGLRRGVFLADANAVIVAQDRLLPMLDLLNRRLPMRARGGPIQGVYAFIDAPDALRKSAADFAALRSQGLRRVYVGVETGHDPLRAFLRKPGRADDVRAAVESIKAGGVAVGLIVMVGVGGELARERHRADTVALLEQLLLDALDLIYLSPFVSDGTTPYDADMAAAGLPAMDDDAIRAEEQRFKQALAPLARRTGARVAHYDLREFVY